jgi:hypothetical protein
MGIDQTIASGMMATMVFFSKKKLDELFKRT